MFSRFLLFFGAAGAGLCAAEAGRRRALRGGGLCAAATGRRGFGARFPAKPCSFVNGHHVFGTKGARPARTWCTIPRKPLLFRRRAPRLWGQRRRRRTGRGASLPAKPCSFVNGHHVFGTKGARPARTWCTIPRKTLFFRQRAPRLWGQRRRRHQIPSL